MESKIIGCLFGLVWTGVCYQAGRVSQQQKNQTFVTNYVQIEHPQPKGAAKTSPIQTITTLNTENIFNTTDGLIIPPYRAVLYPNFKILYSTLHKCPLAVFQHVTKQIADGDAPRRSTFFNQPSIQTQFQSTNDHFIKSGAYKNFNLARGHMAAAGNYSGNKQAKFQTFTYANVIPQNQYNNGGIWNTFQRYSRDLLLSGKCDSVDIVSGPIYSKSQPFVVEDDNKLTNQQQEGPKRVFKQQSIVLLDNGIVVPSKLYKIIQCNTTQNNIHKSYLDGFEFYNKKTYDNQKPLKQFKTSIQSIQKQTGLKFMFGQKDQLTGKLKLPQSLIQFDKQAFDKTKHVLDEKFYMWLMRKATSISEMNGALYRAKQQHILLPLQQLSAKADQLFTKQIKQLFNVYKANKQKQSCYTLSKLIKLNKEMFYLRQLKLQHQQQIKRMQDDNVLMYCYSKVGQLRRLGWQELSDDSNNGVYSKKEKIALNSLTNVVTKQQLKRTQLLSKQLVDIKEIQRRMLHLVNESELQQKFIVQVNIQKSLLQKKQQQ